MAAVFKHRGVRQRHESAEDNVNNNNYNNNCIINQNDQNSINQSQEDMDNDEDDQKFSQIHYSQNSAEEIIRNRPARLRQSQVPNYHTLHLRGHDDDA